MAGSEAGHGEFGSAAIAAVDINIAVGEITGPHTAAALAKPDIHGDFHDAAGDGLGRGLLVVLRGAHALFGHDMTAEADRQPVAIGGLAALAHRHHDAAP